MSERAETPWTIRTAEPADLNFIYSTWIKSYRTGSGFNMLTGRGKRAYFELYQLIVDAVLQREATLVLVAAQAGNSGVIWGYAVLEPKNRVMHYAFVKEAFRRLGIARALAAAAFSAPNVDLLITHKTDEAAPILRKYTNLVYKPSLIFPKGPHGSPERNPRVNS